MNKTIEWIKCLVMYDLLTKSLGRSVACGVIVHKVWSVQMDFVKN